MGKANSDIARRIAEVALKKRGDAGEADKTDAAAKRWRTMATELRAALKTDDDAVLGRQLEAIMRAGRGD